MASIARQAVEIGGGYVRRRFNIGADSIPAGTHLTAGQLQKIGNLRVLVRNGNIETHPPAPAQPDVPAERFITNLGFGKFDVIAGRKLNDRPLTKEEAEELATRP